MEEKDKQEKKLGKTNIGMIDKAKNLLIAWLVAGQRALGGAKDIDELLGQLDREQYLSRVKDSEIESLLLILAKAFGLTDSESKDFVNTIINDVKDFRGNAYIRTSDETKQGNTKFTGEMNVWRMMYELKKGKENAVKDKDGIER